MKTIQLLSLAFLLALTAFGQAAMNSTTLSAAVVLPFPASAGTPPTTIYLTSTTGMLAPDQFGAYQTWLFFGRSMFGVKTVATGYVTGVWAASGQTPVASYASGTTVYWGPRRYFLNGDPVGGSYCLVGNIAALPAVSVPTGNIFNCTGVTTTAGVWFQTVSGTSGGNPGGQFNQFCTGTVGSAETEFLNGAACSGATTATATQVVTQPGVIGYFHAYSSAAVVSGGSDAVTVLKNGSATTITCPIVAGTVHTCADTTHFVQVAVGDVITYSFVSTTSDTAANISISLGRY